MLLFAGWPTGRGLHDDLVDFAFQAIEPPKRLVTKLIEPPAHLATKQIEPPARLATKLIDPPERLATKLIEPLARLVTKLIEPPEHLTAKLIEPPEHLAAKLIEPPEHLAAKLIQPRERLIAKLMEPPERLATKLIERKLDVLTLFDERGRHLVETLIDRIELLFDSIDPFRQRIQTVCHARFHRQPTIVMTTTRARAMPLERVAIVLNVPGEKPRETAETATCWRRQGFGFCDATPRRRPLGDRAPTRSEPATARAARKLQAAVLITPGDQRRGLQVTHDPSRVLKNAGSASGFLAR